MPDISENINLLLQRLSRIAQNNGRSADDVRIMAVSKTRDHLAIREAYACGLKTFGENYVQEAVEKMAQLGDLDIDWHFIGPIQSNKTRLIAEHFAWVHSVDRLKIAQRLNDQRPGGTPPLNICLQINVDEEASKSGLKVDEAADTALAISKLPNLRLRGLMAIPKPESDAKKQRAPFFRLRQLLDTLRALSPQLDDLDTLSMGMSADLEAAIAEGATIIRVGTAIFGPRKVNTSERE